jgi:hypothetical protein
VSEGDLPTYDTGCDLAIEVNASHHLLSGYLMWVAGTGYLIRVLAGQYPDAEEPS